MQFWPMVLSAALTSGDPSSLLVGAPTPAGDLGEAVVVTLDDAVIADNPSEMAYLEWALVDPFGDPLDYIETSDVLQALVQLYGPTMPLGSRVGAALTVAGVAGTGAGAYVGLRKDAAGIVAEHSSRNATAWTPWSSGGPNDLTRTAVMQLMQGNSAAGGRIGVSARDASGRVSRIANAVTNPSSANISGRHTRIALLWGTTTAGLDADAELTAALKLFALRGDTAPGTERQTLPAPNPIDLAAATTVDIGVIGHSIAVGTVVDTVHGGLPVPAGWTLLDNGAPATVWPNGAGRQASLMPYLVEELTALSATGGHVVRRASGGLTLGQSNTDTWLNDLVADFAALGVTPDLLFVWYGANDAQSQAEADAYAERLAQWRTILHEIWPDTRVVLLGEWSVSSTSFPKLVDGTIEATKAEVASGLGSWLHVPPDPATWTLADGIHYDRAGFEAAAADAVGAILSAP